MPSVALVPQAFSGLDSCYELVHVLGSGSLDFGGLHVERARVRERGRALLARRGAELVRRRVRSAAARRPRPSRAPLAASLRRDRYYISLSSLLNAPLSTRHASPL